MYTCLDIQVLTRIWYGGVSFLMSINKYKYVKIKNPSCSNILASHSHLFNIFLYRSNIQVIRFKFRVWQGGYIILRSTVWFFQVFGEHIFGPEESSKSFAMPFYRLKIGHKWCFGVWSKPVNPKFSIKRRKIIEIYSKI